MVSRAGIAAMVIAAASCGGALKANPDGGNGDATLGCAGYAPAGATFNFQIHNEGTETRYMYFGCGNNPPIALQTADGMRGIGPESAFVCGYTCDPVFTGQSVPSGCTDCGPGVSMMLAPGGVLGVSWDRRLWTQVTIPPACSGLPQPSVCALGGAVAGTMVNGTLTYCGTQPPTISCPNPLTASFVADLTMDIAHISIE